MLSFTNLIRILIFQDLNRSGQLQIYLFYLFSPDGQGKGSIMAGLLRGKSHINLYQIQYKFRL